MMKRICIGICAAALLYVVGPMRSVEAESGASFTEQPSNQISSGSAPSVAPSVIDSRDAAQGENAAEGKRDLQAAVAALRQSPVPQPELSPWPMLKGLALCLAAFCGIVFLIQKFHPGQGVAGTRRMRVIERLPVAQKSALLLVEVDGKTKLIGVGPDTITDLEYRERPRLATKQPRFEEILSETKGVA